MRILKVTTGFVTNSSSCSFAILLERESEETYDNEGHWIGHRVEDLNVFLGRVIGHAAIMDERMRRVYPDTWNHLATTIKINRRPWLAVIDVHARTGSDHNSVFIMDEYLRELRAQKLLPPDEITSQWFEAFKHCLPNHTTHRLREGRLVPALEETELVIGQFIEQMFQN